MSLIALPEDLIGYLCRYRGITFKLLRTCKTTNRRVQKHLFHLYLTSKFTKEDISNYILLKMRQVIGGRHITRTITYLSNNSVGDKVLPILFEFSFMSDVKKEYENRVFTPIFFDVTNIPFLSNSLAKRSFLNYDNCFIIRYDNLEGNPYYTSLMIKKDGKITSVNAFKLIDILFPGSESEEEGKITPDIYTFADLLATRKSFVYTDSERLELARKHYSTLFSDEEKSQTGMDELLPNIFEPKIIPPSKLIEPPVPRIMNPAFNLFG